MITCYDHFCLRFLAFQKILVTRLDDVGFVSYPKHACVDRPIIFYATVIKTELLNFADSFATDNQLDPCKSEMTCKAIIQ